MKIKITIGKLEVFVDLNDSETARMVWDNLPITAQAKLWGEEIYFPIGPKMDVEEKVARDIVQVGDAAYWPPGACMCLFFGLTPKSKNGKILPASTVNIFGTIEGDPRVLSQVKIGEQVKVEIA